MNNIEKVKKDVKEETRNVYEEAQNKASQFKDDLKNKAESASQQIKDSVSDFYEEGKKKVLQSEDLLCEYSDTLIKTIKDQPLTSVLVATGIGYLVAKIFKK